MGTMRRTTMAVESRDPTSESPAGCVFVAAETLEAGADVESRAGRLRLTSVEAGYGPVNVDDISVDPGQIFYAGGVLLHNKSIAAHENGTIGGRSLTDLQSWRKGSKPAISCSGSESWAVIWDRATTLPRPSILRTRKRCLKKSLPGPEILGPLSLVWSEDSRLLTLHRRGEAES